MSLFVCIGSSLGIMFCLIFMSCTDISLKLLISLKSDIEWPSSSHPIPESMILGPMLPLDPSCLSTCLVVTECGIALTYQAFLFLSSQVGPWTEGSGLAKHSACPTDELCNTHCCLSSSS